MNKWERLERIELTAVSWIAVVTVAGTVLGFLVPLWACPIVVVVAIGADILIVRTAGGKMADLMDAR